jgi:hypothetical protein
MFNIQIVYEINNRIMNGSEDGINCLFESFIKTQMNDVKHNDKLEHNVKREHLFVNTTLIDSR